MNRMAIITHLTNTIAFNSRLASNHWRPVPDPGGAIRANRHARRLFGASMTSMHRGQGAVQRHLISGNHFAVFVLHDNRQQLGCPPLVSQVFFGRFLERPSAMTAIKPYAVTVECLICHR